MRQFWRSLVDDQTFAIRFFRTVLTVAGAYLTATGKIDPTLGSLMTGGGLLFGSGERNPVTETQPVAKP